MKDDNSLLKGYTSNLIRDGIEVIEELKWPFNDEPFISTNFVINILKTGYLNMEYDSKPYKCGPKLASIIFPGHIFINHKFSDDYSATAIVVNKAVFEKMRLHDVYLNRFKYDEVPHFQLTDSQYEDILKVFATAGIINKLNIEAKNNMLIATLEIIIHMIDHYRTLNEPKPTSGNKRISSELYEIICKNCRKHHDVEFYAEQFHLSPKHFSTVIKKETGYSVGHWIHLYVTADAKMLLKTESTTSLQAISEKLGFPDLPTFSRYFKRETGMSPSEYRRR